MSIRSFAAGILAGLVLGGVAASAGTLDDGVRYYMQGPMGFRGETKYLVEARDWFETARKELEHRRPAMLPDRSPRVLELVEQTCTSRVLDSYNR
jgi:hypothetical protein